MNRAENTVRNIVWGFLNKIVLSVLPFISRTIILHVLGTLYLGIGSLFTSILGMLNLAELGFSSAIVYSMYKPMASGDTDKICALLNFYKRCYRIVGCVILAAGLLILPFLKLLIHGDYPTDVNIYVIYLIYLINTVISYLMFAYKRSLLQANQRNDVESKVSTATIIAQYVLQICLLLVFRNYYIFLIVMVATTIINNLAVSRVVDRLYPEYACRGEIDKEDRNHLQLQLRGLIYKKIGDVVLGAVDNIVISAFLGLTIVAMYGNYYTIVTAVFGFIGIVSTALKNSVGNAVARETEKFTYKLFNILNLIYVLMVAVMATCFLCLIQPFMRLWTGEGLMFGSGMAVLFAVYLFVYKWCDILYVYQEACGLWWETRFIPAIASALNLITNIILVNLIGVEGILLSTILSILLVYDLGYAVILFRSCFKNEGSVSRYIIRQAYYLCLAFVAAFACAFACGKGPENGVPCLLYRVFIALFLGSGILLLGVCRLPEFPDAVSYVKRIFKR